MLNPLRALFDPDYHISGKMSAAEYVARAFPQSRDCFQQDLVDQLNSQDMEYVFCIKLLARYDEPGNTLDHIDPMLSDQILADLRPFYRRRYPSNNKYIHLNYQECQCKSLIIYSCPRFDQL